MSLLTMAKNQFLYLIAHLAKRKVIIGYDEFSSKYFCQRALLSYLVTPLLPPPPFRDRVKFSNRGIAQEIPRVLNGMGYKVDIINFDNVSWVPQREYDLFIGHAGINFERISRILSKRTIKIYLSTGIYWKEWNNRMAKRLYELALRKTYLLKPERFIRYSEEFANDNADGIICLGNQEAVKTYAQYRMVVGINNAIYPINIPRMDDKKFDEGRSHFLFFSGRGNIHKGLDILLESFVGMNCHLHICQHMQEDFINLYHNELFHQPNIHLHGFVKMRSPKFEKLAKQCNWVISASCVEGQPGAILECMGYGLIPILSDSNNIDLRDWGIRLEDSSLNTIRSTVDQASKIDVEECRLRSKRVVDASKKAYSIDNFRLNFSRAVQAILNSNSQKRS